MDLVPYLLDYDLWILIAFNDLCAQIYHLPKPLQQSLILRNIFCTFEFNSIRNHKFGFFGSIGMQLALAPSLDLDPSKNKFQANKANLKFVLTLYTLWTISQVNGTTVQLLISENLSTSSPGEESTGNVPKKELNV